MHSSILIRKLESIAELTPDIRAVLEKLDGTIRELKRGEDVVSDGERPQACTLVLEGLLCRYKIVADGRRQIIGFHSPGDIPDLHSIHIRVMDHTLGAIAPSRILLVPHEKMRTMLCSHPTLMDLLWRDTLIDAAVFREWTVNVGRRSAYARIAHLLCEIFERRQAVGLTDGNMCHLPLTQEDIGDATGLSNVHVNRSLQELRGEELLRIGRGTLTILDWQRLKVAGEFDPTYLHLRHAA